MAANKEHVNLEKCACLTDIVMVSNINCLSFYLVSFYCRIIIDTIFCLILRNIGCTINSGEEGNGLLQGDCDAGEVCSIGTCRGRLPWYVIATVHCFMYDNIYISKHSKLIKFIFLLSLPLDRCCSRLSINSKSNKYKYKTKSFGSYAMEGHSNGRIFYKNTATSRYLHFAPDQEWKVVS